VLVRRVLVAVLAVLGLALLLVGVGMRTVWLPDSDVAASADVSDAPVTLTAPGVMEMRPGPVTVRVEGEGPVNVARMREQDALAWVGDSPHVTVTGLDDERTLATETTPGEAEVPDPAGSVMWLDGGSGDGSAELTWEDRPGRYLLVVAGDGTTAPERLTLTWTREVSTPWAVPLVVAGGVLLAAAAALAAVLLLLARRTRQPGTTPAPDPADPAPAPAEPDPHPSHENDPKEVRW
jgi:hypothetical protein